MVKLKKRKKEKIKDKTQEKDNKLMKKEWKWPKIVLLIFILKF